MRNQLHTWVTKHLAFETYSYLPITVCLNSYRTELTDGLTDRKSLYQLKIKHRAQEHPVLQSLVPRKSLFLISKYRSQNNTGTTNTNSDRKDKIKGCRDGAALKSIWCSCSSHTRLLTSTCNACSSLSLGICAHIHPQYNCYTLYKCIKPGIQKTKMNNTSYKIKY